MADIAYLKIGKHKFQSVRYEVPYSWIIIFNNLSPSGLCRTDVGSALQFLQSRGLNIDDLENNIASYTGWPRDYWNRYRSFLLTEDFDGLDKRLKEDGFDADGEGDYPNLLELLQQLEEDEGLWELVGLYKMFLGLNDSSISERVILDVRDFREYYENDIIQLYADVKQNFIDKVKMHDYLFDYTVDSVDKVSAVQDKIKQLSEDDLINRVILPLLTRMKFHKVERTPYHGQKEKGLDIRPFYEVDKFERRIYYGAQVKAIDIHTNSRKEGNAASINNQIQIALNSDFLDYEDNENKKIDKILLITSGKINDDAREHLFTMNPNRTLGLIDGNQLSNLIVKYRLTDQILHTKKNRRKKAYHDRKA